MPATRLIIHYSARLDSMRHRPGKDKGTPVFSIINGREFHVRQKHQAWTQKDVVASVFVSLDHTD